MYTAGRRLAILAVAAMSVAFGTAASSQTEPLVPNAATFICRPASADESANARMVHDSTSLVCRPIAVTMHMSNGSMKTIGNVKATALAGPDFSHALTPQQINAAYNHWVEKALDIDPETRHSP
jgi:hypothetical protein